MSGVGKSVGNIPADADATLVTVLVFCVSEFQCEGELVSCPQITS